MSDLRNQIGNLSAAEKLDLLDVLWQSLEANGALTEAQCEELDYRMAQYEQNGVTPPLVKYCTLRNGARFARP